MTVTIENLYTGNASTTDYSFTFPYLDTPDIKASLAGVSTTAFSLLNATTVRFDSAPGSGVAIRIYRETAYENPKATFYPGSAIRAGDLNDNTLQNLYVTQEANDKVADAWLTGDPTIISTETWHTSDDTKVATTKAIEARIDAKIDTAMEADVLAGTDLAKTATGGQVTINHSVSGANTTVDNSAGNVLQDITISAQGHVTAVGSTNLDDRYYTETEATANFQPKDAELTELATMGSTTASALADLTQAEVQILDGATVSTSELNTLDGVTATTAELNILDGVTSTTAELNILDGVTSTTAELNILDGVTSTAAELNILDGVTATTDELNKLDGVTATTDELNKTDGLTATPTELNALDGITSNTSELNKLDGVTASTTELNIVSGKTFRASGDGTLTTTSDTEIPSSKVIASHVSSTILATGGFISINNEISFPVTASQPANGVIVSISDAAGTVVNGSGTSTTGRTTDGTPATVTINNFPSSLYGETLATGVGMLVTSTGSSNIYNYHKILAAEADVKSLSDDINDFNARYRIASSAPGSNNDEGDLYFDTSANKMKVYNGSAWDDVASVGSFYINTLSSSSSTGGGSATFNGSAYRFTLSNPASGGAQQLIVSINGVIQKPNTGTGQPSEGFAIDGNDIIFSAAPASGSDFFIVTQGSSVSIGTPSAASVNSTHIIDGSIVNADISSSAAIAKTKLASLDVVNADVNASAAIAGSKLADDSIAEVKLDISNAPANGKYLQYKDDTDKLTWADGASEGTDVKSTGESGTTKFLRVDGDGTCSWQVPPDTNTQLTLNDEDNFASNSATAAASQQSIKAYVDTQVGAISAAPEVTGTASGAIAINKPVAVNTDGTLSQVSSSVISEAIDGSTYEFCNQAIDGCDVCFDPENEKYVIVYSDDNDKEGKAVVATVSGTSISYGTPASFETTLTPTPKALRVIYDPGSQKVVITWVHEDTKAYACVGTVSGTDISFGTKHTVRTTTAKQCSAAAGGGKILFTHNEGNTVTKGYIASISGTTISKGTLLDDIHTRIGAEGDGMSTHTGMGIGVCYHEELGQFIVVGKHGTGKVRATAVSFTADNDNGTVDSDYYELDDAGDGWIDCCYDPINKQVLVVYDGSSSNSHKGYIITVNLASDGTWSKGTKALFYVDDSDDRYIRHNCIGYDKTSDQFIILSKNDDDSDNGYLTRGSVSGTSTFTLASPAKYNGSENAYYHNSPQILDKKADGKAMLVFRNNGDSNHGHAKIYQHGYTSSTLEAGNFIGFSKAAYSNTDTATVNVVGNTTTQSSLTPGSKYYVRIDGTLNTTADSRHTVEAGTALSATKLLIK